MHSDDKPLREIDDTAGSAADDRFEEILQKVISAGAEILRDDESPLYAAIGLDEYEIGMERIVEFNLNGTDFQITRHEKDVKIMGEGHHKRLEDLPRPSVIIKLKNKPDTSDQWLVVDMEGMF